MNHLTALAHTTPAAPTSGETTQQLTERLLAGYRYSQRTSPNLAMAEQEAATTGAECGPPEPNMVTAQVYVTKFGSIDQKAGTFEVEGFFRLWWNDPRMAFEPGSSCIDSIKLLDQIWVPDFYFLPSKKHTIGVKNDSQMIKIKSDGAFPFTNDDSSLENEAILHIKSKSNSS